jgi:peptide/nickel transport system substrate-binding protein
MDLSRKPSGLFQRLLQLRAKSQKAIDSFSSTEKYVFAFLIVTLTASSLFLLKNTLNMFMKEVPARGGEIHEGVIGYPRYINPILSVTDGGKDLTLLIYAGLLKATGDGQIIADMAESYSISDDGTVYNVKIRENAKFHDGTPLTSKDVEFTIKKALDPALKSPKAPNWQGVSVRVISEKEIEFVLSKPYAPFIENLTLGILPEHLWKDIDPEAYIWSERNFDPIGSGPFKTKEIKRDKSGLPIYYKLVPFGDYTLGKPFIKEIYMHFYTNEEKLLEAIKKGEVDSAGALSPKSAIEIKDSDHKILRSPLPRIFALFLNQNEIPIFADKNVRLALSTAVNRKEIVDEILKGFGTETKSPLPASISLLPKEQTDNATQIQEAISILEKAGFTKDANGIMEKKTAKETSRLSFTISTSNYPELKDTALLLKKQWEAIGAEVKVELYELSDLNQNILRPRKYNSLLFGEVIGRDLDLYAFWHSSERNDPGLNLSQYTNSKADKFLVDARSTSDTNKKVEALQGLEKEITNDVPAIFLYSPDFIYMIPKNLRGVSVDTITSGSERFLDAHKWYTDTEYVWKFF